MKEAQVEKKTLMEKLMRYTQVMRFRVLVLSACITLRNFWSERRCSAGLAEQGNAVATKFIVLFSSLWLITHSVVLVVNLPSQAGTYCRQLYTKISTDADGGPRSRVPTAGHSAHPPIDVS